MPDTIAESLNRMVLGNLKRFTRRLRQLDVELVFCDVCGNLTGLRGGERFLLEVHGRQVSEFCLEVIGGCGDGKNGAVLALPHGDVVSAVALTSQSRPAGVLTAGPIPAEQAPLLGAVLTVLADAINTGVTSQQQIGEISSELAQTYEELVLLHKLSTNMTLTCSDANYLQMACDSLTDIVNVEGIAILLSRSIDDEIRLVIAAGSGLIDIDENMTTVLHSRLLSELECAKEALLDSEVDSPFRYEWPANIRNIIAVPLYGTEKPSDERTGAGQPVMGMMVGINRLDKPDFDSTDVKLFNSVATGCAVFAENGRLFNDLKELLIGSLRALTSSIDAKDQYTRGHSERVALISRWIAERCAQEGLINQDLVHKCYLAGLLHDIGKMGIDGAVLRKPGKLTKQEFDSIKMHPLIGADILSGIKQMRDIVPGVLSHHEQPCGRGYPNGWEGSRIPLIGRIVGLADSFDAMTSKRTYRDALSVDDALKEVESNLGTQFDAQVGAILLENDITHIRAIIEENAAGLSRSDELARHGTQAVGTLIR